jgi:hypothetical protein
MHPLRLLAALGILAIASVAVAAPRAVSSGGGHAAAASGPSGPLSLSYNRSGFTSAPANVNRCFTLTDPTCSSRTTRQLSKLRDEALDLQRSDGGRLTPEHRAVLQSKLDAIQKQSR